MQQLAFWNLIIRPPRAKYLKEVMGPTDFTFDGGQGRRRDVDIETSRGSIISCSHFVPVGRGMDKVPVVVYLHGNTSNRLEAWDLVVPFLKQGVSLFCYDAAGCGISEGEYISLGWHERHDLADIISHLRKSTFTGPIALWGWSMGAVTALLYAAGDPSLSALCLESPFANLRRLVEDLAQQGTQTAFKLPTWLIDPAIGLIKMRVQDLADFDIDDLVPLESAKKAQTPAIFISRRDDTFVRNHHTMELLENYGGDCEHVALEGDHSCTRTQQDIAHVISFFCRTFITHAVAAKLPSRIVTQPMAREGENHIPEEHENKQPTPRGLRPVSSSPSDLLWDVTVPTETLTSKPRCLQTTGLNFPEPRPLKSFRGALLTPRKEAALQATCRTAFLDDLGLPPIALEPVRAEPLCGKGDDGASEVTAVTTPRGVGTTSGQTTPRGCK